MKSFKNVLGLLALASIPISLPPMLASCSKGIEKQYKMEVKEIVEVKETQESDYLKAAHCKRSGSLFNYYIILPPEAIKAYYEKDQRYDLTSLTAKATDQDKDFIYGKDTVTDHGYVFVSWCNAGGSEK